MCVIAALDPSYANWLLVILQVAIGLGTVIFVHELGHFAVAKWCGVKCEKFFIGFDIGGYKISRKWGETEYGIGILPLGGYVKMLGQDDNPANIAEQVRESQVAGTAVDAKEITGPDGKKYLIDRRSYLAKSVPQRMAIISAGVIMNVIFAFIFATIAYKIGVPYNPCIVSQASPGSPAWRADIRPGDEVLRVGDVENPSFEKLRGSVMLGDLENGIPFVIRRGSETLEKRLTPERGTAGTGLARVGVAPPLSLVINPYAKPPKHTPAAKAALEGGDEVTEVDGIPVESYPDYAAILAQHPEKPLIIKVLRGGKPPEDDPYGNPTGGKPIEVRVDPRPMRTLGLVMQMGKVDSVQENSPAAAAGIRPGDFIDRISDASAPAGESSKVTSDPMKLPEDLRRMAEDNRDVKFTLRHRASGAEGREAPEDPVVPLRKVRWMEDVAGPNFPIGVPALGIAYRVLNVVDRVEPNSPAFKAGLQSNDVVLEAEFIFPKDLEDKPKVDPVEFSQEEKDEKANWPWFMSQVQEMPEASQVKLIFKRGDKKYFALMTPTPAEGYYLAERGLAFDWITRIRTAKDWNEAVTRGWDETASSLSLVYRFLGKLGTQVPFSSLGGPVTIAQAAGFSAFEGPGKLLVFLTMLSANLAVINFLPIPLLDGGHIVFLAYEGVRGRPASEKFVVAMHTVGFAFIITLMMFVLALDFGIIQRNL